MRCRASGTGSRLPKLELLRRYSRHQNVTARLLKVYQKAKCQYRKAASHSTRPCAQPHAVPRRLGSSTVAALIRAYEAGATTAQLAEQYGDSRTAVKDLLHHQNVVVRRPLGLGVEQVDEAVQLYQSGWLLREIAVKFNVSQETVRRRLVECGVSMRSGHGDHGRSDNGGFTQRR